MQKLNFCILLIVFNSGVIKVYLRFERIKRILKDIKALIYCDAEEIQEYQIRQGKFDNWNDIMKCKDGWKTYKTGDLWSVYDGHFCFKALIRIPERFYGKSIAFYLENTINSVNPQFLLYLNGNIIQGIDSNHKEVLISECAEVGKEYEIAITAYSGLSTAGRANLYTKLVAVDNEVEELYYNIKVLYDVAAQLEEQDTNRVHIINRLNEVLNIVDLRDSYSQGFYKSIKEANKLLNEQFYYRISEASVPKVTAIGHTHIDVAWLWDLNQTREKVARSFSTVLKLMEQYPEYKFMSSQPQLYKFIKEDHPELYEKIKEKVKEGRWEVEGAMWLEADCNVTSGESLVRQILFGKRFFKEEFNKESKLLWLPDVFGYSAALPQILKKSGVDYFMTTKISWNDLNKVPNDTFMWRGIDGSEVFTHFITTTEYDKGKNNEFYTNYNGELNANQVMGNWHRYQNKDINDDTLLAFGYGDGGGGVNKEMLENFKRLKYGIPGTPIVKMDLSRNYFDKLNNKLKDNPRLAKWVGELYLECHRGTLTSMARNKKYNRKSEFLYQDVEFLSSLNELLGGDYPQEKINSAWETILLNQFHDILPGSSIRKVYEDSREQYEKIISDGKEILQNALNNINRNINLTSKSILVYNTLSYFRDDIAQVEISEKHNDISLQDENGESVSYQTIEQDGIKKIIFYARNIPPKGYKTFRIKPSNTVKDVSQEVVTKKLIENKFFKIEMDESMHIISFYDKENDREILQQGKKGNILQAFEDKPRVWENWDVEPYFVEKMWNIEEVKDVEVIENGPVRYCIKITRKFCSSEIIQYMYMYRDISRIDFKTFIDWKEKDILLKAAFPVDINVEKATYDIQYGNIERTTHLNTSWDLAKFEVCGHKWADVSETGYGVSLLNDCKYGYDIKDGLMRITLIKAGTWPNPDADKEQHEFIYSLYPHAGGWREGKTVQMAYNLNVPLLTFIEEKHEGILPEKFSLLKLNKDNVIVEVVKKAENGSGLILRLYEFHNKREKIELELFRNVKEAWECDLMENKLDKIQSCSNKLKFEIKPFEIKTLLII